MQELWVGNLASIQNHSGGTGVDRQTALAEFWQYACQMVVELVGGNTFGSKVMMSPRSASKSAWRKVPGSLSSELLPTMVFPCGTGVVVVVGVGVGDVGVRWVCVGAGD